MVSKAGSTLSGAGTGAAVGSVFGPIGTAVGAIGGGAIGYFLGGDDEAPPTYTPNRSNFTFGLGPADYNYAVNESNKYTLEQQKLDALQQDAYNREAPTQALPTRRDFIGSEGQNYLEGADDAGRAQQLGALQGLEGRVQALDRFANTPQGPSAAQAQLQAGTDAAAKQQYGFARSQVGGGGAALRNAAMNAAGISGNAANTAAMLRAKEGADYQNRRLAALDAAMGGAGTATGYAGQLRGMDQGFAQTQAGQANYDAGAQNTYNQQQQQLEFGVGQNNLNAQLTTRGQNDAATLGFIGADQGYYGMRNQLAAQTAASGAAFEDARARAAGAAGAAHNAQQANDRADLAMGLNSVSSGLAAYNASQGSQPQIKDNVNNFDSNTSEFSSDARLKEIEGREQALAAALETVGNAPGYSYKYKDPDAPGAAPGRHMGPMAQDLERGPLGDTLVRDTPSGKMVDSGRLAMVDAAAITELNRKVQALEAALGRKAA